MCWFGDPALSKGGGCTSQGDDEAPKKFRIISAHTSAHTTRSSSHSLRWRIHGGVASQCMLARWKAAVGIAGVCLYVHPTARLKAHPTQAAPIYAGTVDGRPETADGASRCSLSAPSPAGSRSCTGGHTVQYSQAAAFTPQQAA